MAKKQNKKVETKETNLLDYEPLYDYIVVKALKVAGINGLIRPEQYDDKPEFGVVIKCGHGRLLEDGSVVPLQVKPGDHIFFGRYSSTQTRSAGEDYLIIREDDIMAVKI